MRIDEISAVAQDYLKVIWSAIEWGGPPITTKALAERFGSTQANVSETVKRLATQGLVKYQPYKPVVLTSRGNDLALGMVRRHRLVETFLVATLGYDWREVHDEAERLEHAVSDTMIERIDQLLGHPAADPHGDPIPRSDGTVVRPADTISLSDPDADPGSYTVVRISDADPQVLDRLGAHGIVPGSTLLLGPGPASDQPLVVTGPDHERLSGADLSMIRVRSAAAR